MPPKLAPKAPKPSVPDMGLPGVLPHNAVAKSTKLPGAVIKPIAHPGKLKGKTPIDLKTKGKGVKESVPGDSIQAGDSVPPTADTDTVNEVLDEPVDEVNPPFDPADEYRVMSEWFASAGWVGVPEGGVNPGEPLPELDDEEDD